MEETREEALHLLIYHGGADAIVMIDKQINDVDARQGADGKFGDGDACELRRLQKVRLALIDMSFDFAHAEVAYEEVTPVGEFYQGRF